MALLERLSAFRFLSIPQVAALLFPSQDAAATRLRRLLRSRFVVRLYQAAVSDDPHTQLVYALSRAGAKWLALRHDGVVPEHLSASNTRSGLYLTHTLHRNDVAISLELLARSELALTRLHWTHAPDEVRASAPVRIGRDEETIGIVPDGVFTARWQGVTSANAVEVDMGTVSLERMKTRYAAYHSWWRRGGPAGRYGSVPYRVLTITTTERRLAALRRVAAVAGPGQTGGSGLFWFALLTVANPAEPDAWLRPVWTTARSPTGPPIPLFLPTVNPTPDSNS